METKFENHYVRDKEWAKDILKFTCFKRPIHFVFYILSAICLCFGIYFIILYSYFNFIYFFVPLFWMFAVFFVYFRNVNIVLKRDIELHGKPIDVTVSVTDNSIIMSQSTGSEYTLNFSEVKKTICTKKFICLWSKTNMLYPIKKDGFTAGSYEEFVSFLKNKDIKC